MLRDANRAACTATRRLHRQQHQSPAATHPTTARWSTTSLPSSVPRVTPCCMPPKTKLASRRRVRIALSIVAITRPRPKPRRVNEVVDADYEGQLFTLSEPVSLDIYRRTEAGLAPKTLGEDALRKAERELDQRKQEEFDTARDSTVGWSLPVPASCVHLDASGWFPRPARGNCQTAHGDRHLGQTPGAPGGSRPCSGRLPSSHCTVVSFVFIGSTCLTILQESANGQDDITEWPEMTPIERAADSLSVAIAVFLRDTAGLDPLRSHRDVGHAGRHALDFPAASASTCSFRSCSCRCSSRTR